MNNEYPTYIFYIITGGPGAGKTTLLKELDKNGFGIVAEEARRIIKEQIEIAELVKFSMKTLEIKQNTCVATSSFTDIYRAFGVSWEDAWVTPN